MKKNKVITALSVTVISVVVLFVSFVGFLVLLWGGVFDKFDVRDVASYEKNGYILEFQQLGAPQWPFGPTQVRLVLENKNGRRLNKYDTYIQDDGANASEINIAFVEWYDDRVVVTLHASEMEDREVTLSFDGEAN